MPARDTKTAPLFFHQASRLLFSICFGLLAPAAAMAQVQQGRQPAPTAEQAKERQNSCPVRWGKRPRRTGGPGAETYVSEWGPCKADTLPVPAPSRSMPQPLTLR